MEGDLYFSLSGRLIFEYMCDYAFGKGTEWDGARSAAAAAPVAALLAAPLPGSMRLLRIRTCVRPSGELEEPVYAPYVQRGNFPVLVDKITCKGIRPVPNKNM